MNSNDIESTKAEDEIHNYWNERMKKTTSWFIALNLSDTVFEFNAIREPYNQKHFVINVIYMFFSVLVFMALYLSYNKPQRRNLQLAVMYYIQIRRIFRLFDLEDTKFHFSQGEQIWLCGTVTFAICATMRLINEVQIQNWATQISTTL